MLGAGGYENPNFSVLDEISMSLGEVDMTSLPAFWSTFKPSRPQQRAAHSDSSAMDEDRVVPSSVTWRMDDSSYSLDLSQGSSELHNVQPEHQPAGHHQHQPQLQQQQHVQQHRSLPPPPPPQEQQPYLEAFTNLNPSDGYSVYARHFNLKPLPVQDLRGSAPNIAAPATPATPRPCIAPRPTPVLHDMKLRTNAAKDLSFQSNLVQILAGGKPHPHPAVLQSKTCVPTPALTSITVSSTAPMDLTMRSEGAAASTGEAARKPVREGWIMKRGEHIKNWRPRYFILQEGGELLGYKTKPVTPEERSQALNNFNIKGAKVISTEQPRANCFVLRGLYLETGRDTVERLFCAETASDRDLWFQAILKVIRDLEAPERRSVNLQDFHILKVLGRGAFGKVVMCREKRTGTIYAMKMLKKSVLLEKQEVEHTKTENRVLQTLRHPFLVNLQYSFTSSDRVFFVMEYAGGGELFEHIGRLGRFPEPWVAFYSAEIVLALGYLHKQGVIYRDLKLENLILDNQGHVKIVDFGLSKDQIYGERVARTMCGTPAYMAPEVFIKREYGRSVDWWSLGIVIFEMATGELPFYSEEREEMFRKIFKEKLRFPLNNNLSQSLKSLISHLLKKSESRRLGSGEGDANEVMAAPFFSGIAWNLLEKKRLTPPFKPQLRHETDAPYVPKEFSGDSTELTPTNRSVPSCTFTDFSFKKNSWSLSCSSREMEVTM